MVLGLVLATGRKQAFGSGFVPNEAAHVARGRRLQPRVHELRGPQGDELL
jgi:hypothetical protein